ncbi:MAG TPA: hypothetical protein VN132_07565 [Bdellovibrio sp.]|nr:hypothetical protein [Bdellovibrio sp.]
MATLDTLKLFVIPLEKNHIEYFVTGSTASMIYGEPRLTLDIDLVLHLSDEDIGKFISLFPENQYYCPPEEIILIESRRDTHGHFNLIHPESGLKADIYPESKDPLHAWAFKNRRRVVVGNSEVWLAPPEYIIVRKLEYYREGGSSKHLEDIKKMLPQVQSNLDFEYLEKQLNERQLTSYWEKVRR